MVKCEYCGKEIGLLAVRYTWLDKQNNRAMHDKCYEKYKNKSPEKIKQIDEEIQGKNLKHTNAGIVSIILGIFGVWMSLPYIPSPFSFLPPSIMMNWLVTIIIIVTPLVLGILAVIIGRMAKKEADSYGKYGMVLGIIVIIFRTIAIVATLYVYFTGLINV